MWNYLKKVYNQSNAAWRFQLEHDITLFKQDSLAISKFYSKFINFWAEYTDIVHAYLTSEGLSYVQYVHETTKRDQFLMKLRSTFEGIRSNLLHRNPYHHWMHVSMISYVKNSVCWHNPSLKIKKSSTVSVAYVARGKSRSHYMSVVQCFCCKQLGHYASNCPNKVSNYCKKKKKWTYS